jgi:tRNA A-37 threonylcarbamoyl transferase component Bud32
MQKNLAFYGCKAALVHDAASLLLALDDADGDAELVAARLPPPAEHDGDFLLAGHAISAAAVLHRQADRPFSGPLAETHVLDGVAVKRSHERMLAEAVVHAHAHRRCPGHVAAVCGLVTASGRESSALVTEYAGVDGYRFLRDEPTYLEALEWIEQVARCVAALGGEGVMHGDLKLNNTCRDELGTWRVIDFGLAMLAMERGRLCDTPYIYGPNAAMNTSFDLRVLLWSCILHATSRGPWDHWSSRFECEYAAAWELSRVARRAHPRDRPKAMTRALHAMYRPVCARHDAEFEPLRVLETLRLLRAAHAGAEPERNREPDAPAG